MLVLALFVFLFLPIANRRTVMMKLGMVATLAARFALSVTGAHSPELHAQRSQNVSTGRN
ncbi:exported hypothetical protein [Bradyrhizobium sp. STM 3843]|uniref:hypothetical protein n=1 Tax=Bradyrhizobium sp. STM 3843 TaxID=551947 RepID=UPI000240AF21|nr:hypothetical protein [Bradyrhizobium sp. STM 3843]CCE05708.1 exported hypothetical protein [Bradyrhizobium sp. STM 3843]